MVLITPKNTVDKVECAHPDCQEQIVKDASHRFGVGISHYHPEKGVSYLQIHQTQHCCTREHALEAAHKRIDSYADYQHGSFHQDLNPGDEYSNSFVQQCVQYTPLVHVSSLPKTCCKTGQPLTSDMYIVHVDDSSQGTCYQEILQKQDENPGDLSLYTMACGTKQGALQAAHEILDTIVAPYKRG